MPQIGGTCVGWGMKCVTGINLVGRYSPGTYPLDCLPMQSLERLAGHWFGIAVGYLPCGIEGQEGDLGLGM